MKLTIQSFLLLFLCSTPLIAQNSYPLNCVSRDFDATDFNLNGSASLIGTNTFQLNPNAFWSGGSTWYRRRLDLRVNFRIAVDLYFGVNTVNEDGEDIGADGIAFVLQNLDTGQGSQGGALGYGGDNPIRPSFAIELDTYFNNGTDLSQEDHIAFALDGDTQTTPSTNDYREVNNLEDGNFHTLIISWNPDDQIVRYEFLHNDGSVITNTKSIDLISHLSSYIAFWGFTGSTGGFSNQQMVRFDNNSICVVDATYPLILGNNYDTTTGVVSLTTSEIAYFCSQFDSGYFNTAYHNGENYEPTVGDYVLYNNHIAAPQRLVEGDEVAYMKIRDYNKIIEVQKDSGLILSVYNCP